jgi:3-oxoacyl-[acyl-carrier protein] reductase
VQRVSIPNLLVNNAGILRDGLLALREDDGFVRKMPSAQWLRHPSYERDLCIALAPQH